VNDKFVCVCAYAHMCISHVKNVTSRQLMSSINKNNNKTDRESLSCPLSLSPSFSFTLHCISKIRIYWQFVLIFWRLFHWNCKKKTNLIEILPCEFCLIFVYKFKYVSVFFFDPVWYQYRYVRNFKGGTLTIEIECWSNIIKFSKWTKFECRMNLEAKPKLKWHSAWK